MRVYIKPLNLILIFSIILLITATQCMAVADDSVALMKSVVRGASVYVITADLNDPSVKVDIGLPARGISHSETFNNFIKRHTPIAAVTGTYFDTRTLIPTGSIVVGGKIIYESYIGTAICFTSENKVKFVDGKKGEPCDLSSAECGLRTGPRLLADGEYALNPAREGFRHPGLFGARTRMAIGVTAGNRLLLAYVRTPVTFSKLASIMKLLGARDAVCLDGGTSSAMYYKGRIVQHPGRMLTNVIEVQRRTVAINTPKFVAMAGIRNYKFVIQVSIQARDVFNIELNNENTHDESHGITCEQTAIICEPMKLRFTKCFHTLFPINRA